MKKAYILYKKTTVGGILILMVFIRMGMANFQTIPKLRLRLPPIV